MKHFYARLKLRQEGGEFLLSLAGSVKPLGTLNSFILKLITRRSDSQTWQYVDSHYRVNRWSKVTHAHTLDNTYSLHLLWVYYRSERDWLLGELLTILSIPVSHFSTYLIRHSLFNSSRPIFLDKFSFHTLDSTSRHTLIIDFTRFRIWSFNRPISQRLMISFLLFFFDKKREEFESTTHDKRLDNWLTMERKLRHFLREGDSQDDGGVYEQRINRVC